MTKKAFLLPLLSLWLALPGCGEVPAVRAVAAARADVESTVSSVNSGTVKSEKIAELAFGAVGRVRHLNVKLGDLVRRDAVLAELENDELRTALLSAKSELERVESMFRSGGSSRSNLDQGRNLFDSAKAAHEKSLIRAPFDGRIVEVNIEEGQLSQITAVIPKPLIRIVDLAPRYVRAEVDEVDLSRLKVGQTARIKVLAVRRQPFLAVLRKVVPFVSSIREQDRTSEIELNVESEGILLPVGASADVEIIVDRKEDALAVPAKAVLGRGAERYVFKVENGRATRTIVGLGIFNFDRAEIISGLAQGDGVIIPTEAVELEDGLKVKADFQTWP